MVQGLLRKKTNLASHIGTITRRGKGDPYDHHHSTYVHDISVDNTTVDKHDKTVESEAISLSLLCRQQKYLTHMQSGDSLYVFYSGEKLQSI